jgi:hypothetical protein
MAPTGKLKAYVNDHHWELAKVYHVDAEIHVSISKRSDRDDVLGGDLQSDLVSAQLMPGVDEA